MSLSAADLQKRHALEGAPDPFPSLGEQDTNSSKVNGASSSEHKHRAGSNKQVAKPVSLDTSSEAAFPSLGSAKTPTAASSGGWSDVSRIKRAAVKTYGFTDSLDLGDIDLRTAGKDGKPTTLGDVMKTVMSKTGMIIESSTQRKTGMTTFLIKGDSSHDAAKAKNLLTAMLSSRVTRVIDAPESVLGAIVGTKGATITQLRETHQVKIELPPRKDPASNGTAAQLPNNEDDEEDEPTAQITVTGPAPLVESAIVDLKAIIGTRAKKVTRRIKDVPEHVLPFVASDIPSIEAKVLEAHPEAMISITSSREDKEFSLYGDKVAVLAAMDQLQEAIEAWKPRLSSVTVTIPRSQHRFVLGGYGPEELFEESQVVVLAPQQGEGLALWGESAKLGAALGVVLQKASSQHVTSYDLPGKAEHAKQAHAYLVHTSYLDNIAYAHPDVTVHVTPDEEVERTGKISLDFVGDAAKVAPAVSEVKALMKKLDGGLKGIEVDWLVTKFLVSRHDQKIKQFQEEHNVIVFFQPEEMESSSVILVHDPEKSPAGISASQKQKHLKEVADHILKLASEAPAVKSETMHVDKKWHSAVLGKTDEVIGEGGSLSIKVGSQANLGVGKEPPADDDILIRGPVSEVDRAVKEIAKIVEDAKIDEIETSYNIEFTIPRDYVGRIVGSQGAGVNKLRDTLNVRVDFDDEADDTKGEWAEKGKGKKGAAKNSKVKITGCKQNADEAKKRILDLVDKYADETSETLRIPHQYHSGLIGASGKYVTRLEDKYGVKITYGREQNDESYGTGPKGRENLKADEVLIKGGRKGVAGAKAELLEAAEFEKSNNLSVTFNVPTRSISRIVGKGGASINDIKNQTGAQIDIDRAEDSSAGTSTITVRGDAGATKDAKAAILAVAAGFGDEIEETIYIESKYHRNFIGKGGETLRELITKVGGPTDPKQQAGLVHFPRQGESPDEVHLRGDKSLVNKLKKELETMAATFRDRVVMGVGVPAAQHRTLIGRGGQHLNDLQSKTSTQIWFPGSRAYGSVGDPENISALNDVVPEDLVKVFGSKAACEAAIAELSKAPVAPAQRAPRPTAQEQLARTISVPLKYHNVIHQQGNFFRNIRSLGVFLDQSQIPEVSYTPTRPAPTPVVAAISSRIDDVDEEPETASTDGVEWQVIPNYQDAPEGDAEWVLRAREEEALDSAERMLRMAIEHAESASHVGFLTVADRSAFPRIVGTKGANVSRIRAETGADVTVGKSDNTIVIIGSEDAIELAKAAILQTVQGGKGPRRSD